MKRFLELLIDYTFFMLICFVIIALLTGCATVQTTPAARARQDRDIRHAMERPVPPPFILPRIPR